MHVLIGTSGFQYKAWRGDFYPARCADSDMLTHYASQLASVELNNTFYRMPKPAVVAGWAARVPEDFRFAIKAPQRITHRLRLKDCGEAVAFLLDSLSALGARQGPILFQLPPNFKVDLERLGGCLAAVPEGVPVAFEFRHESWRDETVYAALRDRNAAFCIADVDGDDLERPWPVTSDFGYLRLRRDGYTSEELSRVADRIRAQPWERVHAYFKHEQTGPALARELTQLCQR